MSKIKKFIRYFLILMFMCALPSFVYADEEAQANASIRIDVRLTTGTHDGAFTFRVKKYVTRTTQVENPETGELENVEEQVLTEVDSKSIETNQGTGSYIFTVDADTDYIVTLDELGSAYQFVSLESGNKIITNNQTINITTGAADSVTTIETHITSNGTGPDTNKETNPIYDPETKQPTGKSILSLSVTGKANTTVTSNSANVLIIYDTSASMHFTYFTLVDTTSNDYNPQTKTYYRYTGQGIGDSKYQELYWHCESNNNCSLCTRTQRYGRWVYTTYTGDIYENSGNNRAQLAEPIVKAFAANLLSKGVNLALETFDGSARRSVEWTRSSDTFMAGFSTANQTSERWYTATYTNWEEAFYLANSIVGDLSTEAKKDPIYVVFITDGEPTRHGINGAYTGTGTYDENNNSDYYALMDNTNEIQTITANIGKLYGIYAFGKDNNNLDDLIYYANSCFDNNCHQRPESEGGVSVETVDTPNYYSAVEIESLETAISSILHDIVNTAGFGSISVEDGTTTQVKVSSEPGAASLLEVDPSTFTYWLTMPGVKDGNNCKVSRKNRITGVNETITFSTVDAEHINGVWTSQTSSETSSQTYNDNMEGTITQNESDCTIKYKWTSTSFYDFDSPTKTPINASFENGAIEWDLSTLGKLIDNVTYTVDVEVWPSQEAQDLIADLMNNPAKYDTLDDGVRDYIERDEATNTYTIRTNTKALVSYTYLDENDNPSESGTSRIPNPTPIGAEQDEITVQKVWPEGYNTIDPNDYNVAGYDRIDLYLRRDNELITNDTTIITLNKNNDWTKNVFLSMGSIELTKDSNGNITAAKIVEKGHDYTFAEKDYHWNLIVRNEKIVHPMLINGVATTLVTTDLAPTDIGIGSATFKVVDGTTYYQICRDTCSIYTEDKNDTATGNVAGKIVADNYRRSNINIKKQVIGDYNGDDLFPFNIKLTSTETLWFSIYKPNPDFDPDLPVDKETNPETIIVMGEEAEGIVVGDDVEIEIKEGTITGYYSVPSGVEFTVKLKEDWNVRFTNVPINTSFEVTEGAIPTELTNKMYFENIEYNQAGETISGRTITGTADESNKIYNIIYNNRYMITNVTVTKEWKKDGNTTTEHVPQNITVEAKSDKTGINVPNATQTLTGSGNKPWTYTWEGLPKYVWNDTTNEYDTITYTVTETKINGNIIPSNKKFEVKNSYNAVIGRWVAGDPVGKDTDTGKEYTITNTWAGIEPTNLNFAKIAFGTDLTDLTTAEELEGVPTLTGAKFKLYRYDLNAPAPRTLVADDPTNWTFVTSNDGTTGRFSFNNIYAGEYRLVEIETPDGYVMPGGEWKIVITENEDGTLTISLPESIEHATAITYKAVDNTYYVYNEQVPEMPSTGARGIIDFSLIGLILMTLGSFFLIMNQKEKI